MNATLTLSNNTHTYHSYLVRLWRDKPHAPWRASAQCVQTGKTRHFANLASLWVFLQTESMDRALDDKTDVTWLAAN